MEHVFVSNGTTQLVLIPENALDTLLLERIVDGGPVEIEFIRQPVGILGQNVTGGVIIRKKSPSPYDTTEVETLPWLQPEETHLEKSR